MPVARSFPTSQEIAAWLNRELGVALVADTALNGLQVESRGRVRRVAAAVDASLASFKAAVRARADLLVVHHGLFWGQVKPVRGAEYERLRLLLSSGLGVYASHLPLDRHPRWGNNAQLARSLGLRNLKPFGNYHGQTLGFGGALPQAVSRRALAGKLGRVLVQPPRVLALGPDRIRRVAVVSGGAGELCLEAAAAGYEAFVTGEMSHSYYHGCREAGLNVFLGGHYATEVFGVKALAQAIGKKYHLPIVFLDIPTGL